MNIQIFGNDYTVVGAKEKITVADSFVVKQNKIGSGNGEAKLYIGNEGADLRDFFGGVGFSLNCFLLKQDLAKYLEETKNEYLAPEQPYLMPENLPVLWENRKSNIESQPEIIPFYIQEQVQIAGPRVYIKSTDSAYELIRALSLPNITYISIVKLADIHGEFYFYFKLFADFFGEVNHPFVEQFQQQIIEQTVPDITSRQTLIRARIGQGRYREQLLNLCPLCPITLITDDRLLIASHIKPWSHSNDVEKIDPYNGFMLSPTYDYLFDRGFISFRNDKRIILSPFLSKMTYSKLGLAENRVFPFLPIEGRERYLEYHRQNIFK